MPDLVLDAPEANNDTVLLADMLAALGEAAASNVITEAPRKSMVKLNGKDLPERWPVYDENGIKSMVPTAALQYHLTKRRAGTNRRAFYLEVPKGVVAPTPINETCPICTKERQGVAKPFYDEMDLLRHMRNLHPLEQEFYEKRAEKEERGNFNLLGTIATMSPEEKAALRALLGSEPETEQPKPTGRGAPKEGA